MVLPVSHNGWVATVAMETAGRGKPPKTLKGFKRRDPFPKPIRKFDDSDLSEMKTGSASTGPAAPEQTVSLPRTVPTHLLMISVLEQLCMMYERDETKARQLFKLLCQHLESMRVVSPLTSLDELSGMRAQYRYHVHKMILAASATLHKSRPALPAPMKTLAELSAGLSPLVNGLTSDLPFVSFEDVVRSHTSRYRQEFVELDQLGRGGFGSVFRAQNKLDGRQYAVKKIKFRHANPNVLMKVLREVKALANLQHPNIIGYNGAWLEYEKPTFNSFNSLPKLVTEDSKSSIMSKTGTTFEDSDIVFEEDDVHEIVDFQVNSYGFGPHDDVSFGSDVFSKSTNCIDGVSVSSHNNQLIIPRTALKEDSDFSLNSSSGLVKIPKVSSESSLSCHEAEISENLFNLSMSGRCENLVTKRHSLEKTRNSAKQHLAKSGNAMWRRSLSADPIASGEKVLVGNSPVDLTNYTDDNFLLEMTVTLFIQMELCSHTLQEWLAERNSRKGSNSESVINVGESMRIFQQLVRGVHYIHSQGVLHRDLKPRNIFLNASDLHVKVGDFGLARENLGGDLTETILSPPADLKAHMFWEDHTHGVGTSTYAAPEQLARSLYDNKCDMYSLGVILYEMFEQFSTEMERHEKLKVLRDGCLPEEFVRKWPEQAKTIALLTSVDPAMRPSARELLDSELFMSKAQVIRDLRRTVKEQETEIELLRRILQERDDEISWLKQNF